MAATTNWLGRIFGFLAIDKLWDGIKHIFSFDFVKEGLGRAITGSVSGKTPDDEHATFSSLGNIVGICVYLGLLAGEYADSYLKYLFKLAYREIVNFPEAGLTVDQLRQVRRDKHHALQFVVAVGRAEKENLSVTVQAPPQQGQPAGQGQQPQQRASVRQYGKYKTAERMLFGAFDGIQAGQDDQQIMGTIQKNILAMGIDAHVRTKVDDATYFLKDNLEGKGRQMRIAGFILTIFMILILGFLFWLGWSFVIGQFELIKGLVAK